MIMIKPKMGRVILVANILASIGLVLMFCFAPIFKHAHADSISSGNTIDNNLVGRPAPAWSTRVIVPTGSGNWTTVNLNPSRKYYVYNYGFDHTGSTNTNPVKVLLNAATEPDAGGNVTFTTETNTDIIQSGVAIYPIKGTSVLSFKAGTGEAMVIVRTIETTPQEQ